MEYDDSPEATDLASRVHEFVDEVVIPVEREHLGDGPVDDVVVDELREEARDRGVYCPIIGEEYGGMGMDYRDMIPVFEAAGRSLLADVALRIDAPDEGCMRMLELIGTEEQKERWLRPIVRGEMRTGFSMTEPMQGAGSDPTMIRTTAEKDGDEWVIDGHKWWTHHGFESEVLIVMARTDEDAHPHEGCSLFLVPTDTPGVKMVREIPHLGGDVVGKSVSETKYENVRIPEENLFGEVNEGFTHAQQHMGPNRLGHCARYTGMAERALEIAKAYASERQTFDEHLSEKQSVRFDVADAETRLHAARAVIRHAADRIAAGERARLEVPMAKVFTASVTQEAIDTAVQICGGPGISKDLPLADFYENVRWFRIIDGADEVHKRTIARSAFRDVDASELESLSRF